MCDKSFLKSKLDFFEEVYYTSQPEHDEDHLDDFYHRSHHYQFKYYKLETWSVWWRNFTISHRRSSSSSCHTFSLILLSYDERSTRLYFTFSRIFNPSLPTSPEWSVIIVADDDHDLMTIAPTKQKREWVVWNMREQKEAAMGEENLVQKRNIIMRRDATLLRYLNNVSTHSVVIAKICFLRRRRAYLIFAPWFFALARSFSLSISSSHEKETQNRIANKTKINWTFLSSRNELF